MDAETEAVVKLLNCMMYLKREMGGISGRAYAKPNVIDVYHAVQPHFVGPAEFEGLVGGFEGQVAVELNNGTAVTWAVNASLVKDAWIIESEIQIDSNDGSETVNLGTSTANNLNGLRDKLSLAVKTLTAREDLSDWQS